MGQTWDQVLREILISQQIEKYGISVSDREVDFVNRNQPLPHVQNLEHFQTDGEFDRQKYMQFLDDPGTYSNPQWKQFILGVENAVRQNLLYDRLLERVIGGVKVTGAEVRDAYVDENEKVRIAYAGLEAHAIPDSLAIVSDSEIQAHYEANAGEYRQDAAVRLSFVSFAKTPSSQDETDTEAEIRRLLSAVREGSDFGELAEGSSDDPGSAKKGGDLGFFGRGQMVKAFEEVAFALEPGEVSEPFRTQYGWHIIKSEGREGKGDSLKVHARHILLQVQAGRNTLDSLRLAAEEFVDRTQETGFDAAAADMGLTPQETGFLTTGSFFPVLRNRSAALVRGFLEAQLGESSPLYSTEQGLYVFVLREKRPAGSRPLEEVRNRISTQLKTRKKVDIASQRVSAILDPVRGGISLEAAAKASGLRFATPPAFARNDVVPGVGARTALSGEAFRLKQGDLSDVISAERGAYVLKVLERRPIDEADYETGREALSQRLLNQKRNEIATAWYEALKDESDIVDNRHRSGYDY